MAVVKKQIILRKRRKDGERAAHHVKLDQVGSGDTFIVEIVVDKKNRVAHYYRFSPEQLTGKKSVNFALSNGGEVHWLAGVKPERINERDLPPEPEAAPEPKRRGRKPKLKTKVKASDDWRRRPRGPIIRKVLIFDTDQKLDTICENLEKTAKRTNLLPASIDKLCKTKKPSQDTGLYFRYLWKILDFDILDFTLTVTRYDELCKRKPKGE